MGKGKACSGARETVSSPSFRAPCNAPVPSVPAQSPQVLGPQDTQGLWGQGVQVLGHLDESCLQGHLQELALWLGSLRTGHNLMM